MTVHHHLDQATLMRYASGDLDEAFSVIVTSHLAMCEECRQAARRAEDVGGQLLEDIEQVTLPSGLFDHLMREIDSLPPTESESIPALLNDPTSKVPTPLQRYVGDQLDAIKWKLVAPGVRKHMITLSDGCDSSLYMLKISAGKAVPEHGHGGAEMTLILSGAYRDDMGRFGPGDIEDLDEHVEHQPKVEPDAPCICLVATESPTKFKGVFSRLLQPIVGI